MSVRTSHSNQSSLFYITFTCFNWLPLFEITNSYDLLYKWFHHLSKEKEIKTTAYVIMPNHVHCILFFPSDDFSLNKIVGNGKRFMAYEIVKRLKRDNQSALLTQLADGLSARERRKGQQHKVFEESFDAKNIANEKFLIQKINYMHLNPVQGNITWFPIGGNMRIVVQGFMSCKELITLRRFTTRKAVT